MSDSPIKVQVSELWEYPSDSYVVMECNILTAGHTPTARITEAHFECARCKNVIIISQDDPKNRFIEPTYCYCSEKKGVFRLLMKESKFVRYEELKVYDTDKRHTLKVELTGDLVRTVREGDHVTLTGTLKCYPIRNGKNGAVFGYHIEAKTIEKKPLKT
jgi:Predicted ATPase involved in replication control, Cdc46/Mcm family